MLKAKVLKKGALEFVEVKCNGGTFVVYDNTISTTRVTSTIALLKGAGSFGKDKFEMKELYIIGKNGLTGKQVKTRVLSVRGMKLIKRVIK